MTTVVWPQYDRVDNGGMWDQGLLRNTFDALGWTHTQDWPTTGGAVVVVPGRFLPGDAVARLTDRLALMPWVVLIVTSDEESLFDWRAVTHPNMALWVMTPRPDTHEHCRATFIGEGYKADTPDLLATCDASDRPLDVFFAGQVTHRRRVACLEALDELELADTCEVLTRRTDGFTEGMERTEYLRTLAVAKVAPCPSGPETPDSFRLYEALEAHCIPIADAYTPRVSYPAGYWQMLFDPPFEVIEDWAELPKYVDAALAGWPANANRIAAWWMRYKRSLRCRLADQVTGLSGQGPELVTPSEQVTVLIPTSPIPSHPGTLVIEETVESVRQQLPGAEIVLMCDGVRSEQAERRADYEEYLRRLLWLAGHRWGNVVPLISDHHAHQANLTREALGHVRTPLVLFVEHDTPLCGEFDWSALCAAVRSGRANVIRFHHEAQVLDVHQYLMLDTEPTDVEGAPLLRTVQWSQRPHLAATGFYRTLIGTWFPPESRTMIEDRMHGVVENAWWDHGEAGWEQFRLWLYAPAGNLKRSEHLDGREGDPKYDMKMA